MSVYNFNDREHERDHSSPGYNFRSNGTVQQAGYHQMESDFLSRNLAAPSSHVENSVQLTRPTSKTALLVRQRRAMLEQLSCFICKGYLIDATTIDECMDSFCKSCIVSHLRTHAGCPKCGAVIRHNNLLSAIRPDKVLQDIVYKLIPGLYDDEMKRRRDFYREFYGANQPSDDDDGDSSSSTLTIQGSNLSGERYGIVLHPKPFYKPTDSIDLSIEPQTRGENTTIYYDNKRQSIVTCFTGSLQQRDLNNGSGSIFSSVESQLFKTYLRCPAKFTILQLKKFIAAKFNICRDDTIHLLYLNESLREEYSLIDVAYIYDWRGIEHMQLFYIIERDLSKVNMNEQRQDNHPRKITRQSVGISTQTVKRVCIDPQPKYYGEKNNNGTSNNIELGGRSMRSRNESPNSHGAKSSQTIQSSSGARSSSGQNTNQRSFSIQANGTSTKRDQSYAGQSSVKSRQVVSNVSSSIRNQIRQTSTGPESRSLRSQAIATKNSNNETSNSQPKIDMSSNGPNQSNQIQRSASVQHQAKNDDAVAQADPVTHIVPYTGGRFRPSPANATQSSIVTLASFTEARTSNLVTSVSSSSASVQTLVNNQHDVIHNTSLSYKQPEFPSALKVSSASRVQSTPQLAFSFVTERGITIVRRLNNQDEPTQAVTTNAVNQSMATKTSIERPIYSSAPTTSMTTTANSVGRQPQSSSANLNLISNQSSSQATSSHRANEDAVSSRHNLKAKPVYKLFVDPTKLKSPNFKKLGYTARH